MIEEMLCKAEFYVTDLLNKKLLPLNYYHNAIHTRQVVSNVKKLAELERCSDEDVFLLVMAAWFHDTGYIFKDKGHEEESVKIALEFIKQEQLTEDFGKKVAALILATKVDAKPVNKLEAIIKDADYGHLASKKFMAVSYNLLKEVNAKNKEALTELEWLNETINFFKNHSFYSISAKKKWQPKKELNALAIHKRIDKITTNNCKKNKKKTFGTAAETMFKVQLKNHIQLSAIADTKANILLSVNAIIISVALSNLVPKLELESQVFLVYPTLILILFSVASIVLSVLSTRPKTSDIAITKDMIKKSKTNILFFGNFYKMNLADFEWGINHLIKNEDKLYSTLTKDLYYLGVVLNRKYKLLRVTYTVFMFGIVISAAAYIISYYTFFSI